MIERGDEVALDREAAHHTTNLGRETIIAECDHERVTQFHASPRSPECA